MGNKTKALVKDKGPWKILIPTVGWRQVSNHHYGCPYWKPDPNGPPYGKGLLGQVSLRGKKVAIQWIPDTAIKTDIEFEGELIFL